MDKLNIYIANDYGFCGNFNSQVARQIKQDKNDYKIIIGKKIIYHDDKTILKIEKDKFYKEFNKIEKAVLYQLRMCECISRAAENVIRNQITSEALDKIEEIEIERANIERKEKKDKLVRKTVENYKKLAGREEEDG